MTALALVQHTLAEPGLIGRRIHEARRQRGLRQSDVARRIGVSQAHISQIELGRSCDSWTVRLICDVLGLDYELLARLATGALSETEANMKNDPRLRADDRELLTDIYRAMVARGPRTYEPQRTD